MPDIRVTRGDTLVFDVYATRFNETTELDEPIPLAGAKAWFTVKRATRDPDNQAIISVNTADDPTKILIANPAGGQIRVDLDPADTLILPKSYLPYDVQILEADGTVTTVSRGSVEVDRDTTVSST